MRQLTLLFTWNVWLFRLNDKEGKFVVGIKAVSEKQAIWRAGVLLQTKYDMNSSFAIPKFGVG